MNSRTKSAGWIECACKTPKIQTGAGRIESRIKCNSQRLWSNRRHLLTASGQHSLGASDPLRRDHALVQHRAAPRRPPDHLAGWWHGSGHAYGRAEHCSARLVHAFPDGHKRGPVGGTSGARFRTLTRPKETHIRGIAIGVRHRRRKLGALKFPFAGAALYVSRQFAIAFAIVMAPYVDSPRRISHWSRISARARKSHNPQQRRKLELQQQRGRRLTQL